MPSLDDVDLVCHGKKHRVRAFAHHTEMLNGRLAHQPASQGPQEQQKKSVDMWQPKLWTGWSNNDTLWYVLQVLVWMVGISLKCVWSIKGELNGSPLCCKGHWTDRSIGVIILNTDFWTQQKCNVKSTVKLVHFWNPDSNRSHQVQEVIKKIPFGVSKKFPEQSADWVLAYCCWKCLLTDTGHDGWHAANFWLECRLMTKVFLKCYGNLIYT